MFAESRHIFKLCPFSALCRRIVFPLFGFLFSLLALPTAGQTTEILADHIHTLRLAVNGNAALLPVIKLGSGDRLEVSFDDMTHEYRRYTYSLQHCERDFTPTESLFENEYVDAAAEEEVIEDYTESRATTTLYTHYSFELPNARMRPLIAGNYLLTISGEDDEGEPEVVARARFGIIDEKVSVSCSVSTDTEIDRDDAHQQLTISVGTRELPQAMLEDALSIVVLQNCRWDNAVIAPEPTSQGSRELLWEHSRALIFPAGNEFRKFEMLSTRVAGMRVVSLKWFEPLYHAEIQTDQPARNYLYDEDQNGQYVVRCETSDEPDSEADYVLTHFTLEAPHLDQADVYLYGLWTDGLFSPRYRMAYDDARGCYTADVLLKQGYYSYQYLTLPRGSRKAQTLPVEGDFFQAENTYTILVYYRPPADRYTQLVGLSHFRFRP